MAILKTPYLVMRDGRPRWVPSPKLRDAGHKGRDLKYPPDHTQAGQWMDEADAHRAARALNEAVERAPVLVAPAEDRTMGALFDRIRLSPRFLEAAGEYDQNAPVTVGVARLKLKRRTIGEYLRHFEQMRPWCGDVAVTDLDGEMVEDFYHDQATARGLTTATKMMRSLKMAINIAIKKMRWLDFNPVTAVRLVDADGRLEIFEPAEIAAILAAAEWCALPSVGDAFVIGLLAGQRKQDILPLARGVLASGFYVIQQRKKNGYKAFVPVTQPLLLRIEAMRARTAASWPGVRHTLEVVNSRTGRPYPSNAKVFGEDWRLVRAVAAGGAAAIEEARRQRAARGLPLPDQQLLAPVPSVAAKLFSDTRDTAVTLLMMAGCSEGEIANITGHSLTTVRAILDKHYFKRNAELAMIAGKKLDAYLATSEIRWA